MLVSWKFAWLPALLYIAYIFQNLENVRSLSSPKIYQSQI